jgi:hypothetical protein
LAAMPMVTIEKSAEVIVFRNEPGAGRGDVQ